MLFIHDLTDNLLFSASGHKYNNILTTGEFLSVNLFAGQLG